MERLPRPFVPEYWRQRSAEAQELAAELRDFHAKRTMLQIAMMYSAMALRLETSATPDET